MFMSLIELGSSKQVTTKKCLQCSERIEKWARRDLYSCTQVFEYSPTHVDFPFNACMQTCYFLYCIFFTRIEEPKTDTSI